VFRQYIRYLGQRKEIKNLFISDEKELQQFTLDVEDGKKQVNPKCKINKRARKYITVMFKYDNYFVGLLELENTPKNANSTWLIISNRQVKDSDFNYFINLYCKEDKNIADIIENHSKSNPKFTKKNHERNVNLGDKQLVMWYTGLVSKII
jgi:hypothetical protein